MSAPGALGDAVAERLARFDEQDVTRRLWAGDTTLWKPGDAGHQAIVAQSLGWLTVFEDVRAQVGELEGFAVSVREEGYRQAVLLGMGGSSLAAEVMSFALARDAPDEALELVVLDTTDSRAIAAVEDRLDLETTLFIVASKSGGTTETASLHAYFYDRLHELVGHDEAGRHFIAITDEGTSLQAEALAQDFRAVFINPSDIGGRYSALSFFGLVPAGLFGADLGLLLARAVETAAECRERRPAAENPALVMGAWLAEAARCGRDKLTIVASPPVGNFGSWAEQLVAESTGKEGRGLFPVDVEPLGPPEVYGDDRAFVYVRLGDGVEADQDEAVRELEESGFPVHTVEMADAHDIAGQFVLWELAVAVCGAVLGIDPFDQPNVQESKDNTRRVLALMEERGLRDADALELPAGPGGERAAYELGDEGLEGALRALLGELSPPAYVALQGWLTPGHEAWRELQAVRLLLRDRRHVATSEGFGPRFLHSTGQYHKGGPGTGVFLQLYSEAGAELAVPGRSYSFRALKAAQALGDLEALLARGRRALRVDVGEEPVAGLAAFRELLERVLAG
jgi:glucose-6-phosphate isomerase